MSAVFEDPDNILDTITVRGPQFMQKNAPTINPRMQVALSGKVRTYIETPVDRLISLTWDLMTCPGESLLGLMSFSQVKMTLGGNQYLLTLLDDVYKVLNENNYSGRVTLNFKGRKL